MTQTQTPGVAEVETEINIAGEDEQILTCQRHPNVETTLRCYICEAPMCVACARRTPVGYICRDCQRGRKRRFEQSRPLDYVIAGIVAVVAGAVASILALLGAWWFLVFLSPLAGAAIAEIVWRLVKHRYGQHLWWIVGLGIILGSMPVLALNSLRLIAVVQGNLWGISGILTWGLHIVLTVGSAIARLRLT